MVRSFSYQLSNALRTITTHNKTMQSLITCNVTQDGFSLPFTSISSPSHDASVMSLGYTSNINP